MELIWLIHWICFCLYCRQWVKYSSFYTAASIQTLPFQILHSASFPLLWHVLLLFANVTFDLHMISTFMLLYRWLYQYCETFKHNLISYIQWNLPYINVICSWVCFRISYEIIILYDLIIVQGILRISLFLMVLPQKSNLNQGYFKHLSNTSNEFSTNFTLLVELS